MQKKQTLYRLFFAIDLPLELKKQLIEIQGSCKEIANSPVAAQNFHITLSFLGSVNDSQLETILDNFKALTMPAFEIQLNHFVFFNQSKVLAISLLDSQQHLLNCKKQIEKQLTQFRLFNFDKKNFIPHITLFRQVEEPPKESLHFDTKIKVNRVNLMLSQQNKSGVFYEQIESWPLQNKTIKQQLLGFNID